MITSIVTREADLFLATDRCDRCGARAQVRVELISGNLQFCAHHFGKHRAALEQVAVSRPTFAS